MKYDKIVAMNQEKGKRNIETVKGKLNEMISKKEKISITALAQYTKLDRSYFYRNIEARKLVEEAMLQQGECYNPKKIIFDRASREVNTQLKIQIQTLKNKIKMLEIENQQLLDDNLEMEKLLKKYNR